MDLITNTAGQMPEFSTEQSNLIKNCYMDFTNRKTYYDIMHRYYKGRTDAVINYQQIDSRSNRTINFDFMSKFIDEEVSYSVGNDITYISRSGDTEIIDFIHKNFAHWSKNHDCMSCKKMLKYKQAYELYYFDEDLTKNPRFSCKIISPRNGYAYTDENGRVILFLHIFKKKFDSMIYLDVYTPDWIYHLNSAFGQVQAPSKNLFGVVPVGIARSTCKTIYETIKAIQDAYERNFSDISNEISDFRNAYLTFMGCQIDENDLPEMKAKGIINVPNVQGNKASVGWLIKNINDTFIQNTLSSEEDKMYQLTSHINHNEKMQSNLSGIALRSRLISLEDKCKLNEGALADCITTRLQMLFLWDKIQNGGNYDYRDIEIKFTPNVPQDVLNTAQIIQTLGNKLSTETGLSLLPFIANPQNEIEKINKEQAENPINVGGNLLNGGGGDDNKPSAAGEGE